MRSQKGITLIALVITIIVMLILVAVTIRMAVNGGLFDYAKKASQETNKAMQDESEIGSGNIGGESINDIVNRYTTTTE